MKELIPLFTTMVAVAGTLGGVFITNISTTRRQSTTFKREMLEEIYKTANEMYYLVVKDDQEFMRSHFMPTRVDSDSWWTNNVSKTVMEKRSVVLASHKQLKNDMRQLDSKFNMLVSLYFDDLVSPALEFSEQYQQYIENRYRAALTRSSSKTYPYYKIPLTAKEEFLVHVKAEVKKNKFF